MTDGQILAAAAILDAHGRPDLGDAVMGHYRRPTPTVEPPECNCHRQRSCHLHPRPIPHDAEVPPNTDRPMMED